MGILAWFKRQLQQDRAIRYPGLGMSAAYWGSGVTHTHSIKNISITGAYLYDRELWPAGTLIQGTIVENAEAPNRAVTVGLQVIRHGPDGMGVRFMPQTKEERLGLEQLLKRIQVAADPDSPPHSINQSD